jgi:nucleoside-diphosphate-sugar epimerase
MKKGLNTGATNQDGPYFAELLFNTYAVNRMTGFQGNIVWDRTKPDGQPRRMLDVTKAENYPTFKAKIPFEVELKNTIDGCREKVGKGL